jgi:hypothetical protein
LLLPERLLLPPPPGIALFRFGLGCRCCRCCCCRCLGFLSRVLRRLRPRQLFFRLLPVWVLF